MSLLVETIKVENGKLLNLSFHNDRMVRTLKELFNVTKNIDLAETTVVPQNLTQGVYKCRVVYDAKTAVTEFLPYSLKHVRSLKIIHDNSISYSYKFSDRSAINGLLELKGPCDDILIIKNGFVTDSSIANVVFKDRYGKWVTPSTYLLPGTMRSELLKNGKITAADIKTSDINNYIELRLINSMRGINDSDAIPVSELFF